MHEAGMRQIFLGIETVHQQSLDVMNKRGTTPEMTRKVVPMLHDRGISIFGGIIIGFPGETKTMVHQTIEFARSLDLTFMQFTPITAFPGTDFYQEMRDSNFITSKNFKHYDLFHPMMRTPELTNTEIYRLVGEIYASTYLDKAWIKTQAKRYLKPFGKYSWMFKNVPRFIKTVIMSGMEMFHSQGIYGSILSEEIKELMKNGLPPDLLKEDASLDSNLLIMHPSTNETVRKSI